MASLKSLVVFVTILFLFFASAPRSQAQMEFHPYFFVEQEYTDNLFLEDTNEDEDWVTTLEPGINIIYNSRSVDLSLDYSLQYIRYQDNDDENIEDFEDMQRANLNVLFFAERPFTLTLTEEIARETLDESENNFEDNEVENRSTVFRTTVLPSYRLQVSPTFSLVFDYIYNRVDFAEPEGDDWDEHVGRFSLVKQLSSNTEIFARYAYIAHQSEDDEDDFDQQDYTLGLSHQFGPRLSGSAEVGISQIEYDDNFDSDNPHWLLSLDYRLTEALTFKVAYDQSYITSATEGLTESQTASFSAVYEKRSLRGTAEVFWREADFVRTVRKDEFQGARFDLSIPLTRAFSVGFDAEYEKAMFEDVTDEDADRYTFGTSLGYEYRRIFASLGYRYRSNSSDIDINDYTNNIFSLSASVRF